MAEAFDPYYEWLGIPRRDQPPNHYRLLGIELFEENANVIERSADRQMSHIRTFQAGKHGRESQELLNRLSAAKLCLLHPDKKQAYDEELRSELETAAAEPVPPAIPAADGALPPVVDAASVPAAPAAGASGDDEVFDFPAGDPAAGSSISQIRRALDKPVWKQPVLLFGGAGLLAVILIVGLFGLLANRDSPAPAPPAEITQGQPDEPPGEEVDDGPPAPQVVVTDETVDAPADASPEGPWPAVSPVLAQKIELADGMVSDEFAFCQTMLLDQFVEAARELRPAGYRPIRMRPYRQADTIKVAAVWLRDGLSWRMVVGADESGVMRADEQLVRAGYQATDVAGMRHRGDRYLAVWSKSAAAVPSRIVVGAGGRDLWRQSSQLMEQQFVPVTQQEFVSSGGSVRTSQVWLQLTPAPGWQQFTGSAEELQARLQQPDFPLDVSVRESLAGGGSYHCRLLSGVSQSFKQSRGAVAQHLDECRAFAAEGYRPAAISVADVGGEHSLVAVSIWHQAGQAGLSELVAMGPAPDEPPAAATRLGVMAGQSHALRFDGRGRVVLQDTLGLADLSRPFTAEVWIRWSRQAPAPAHYVMGNGAMSGYYPEVAGTGIAGWLLTLQGMSSNESEANQLMGLRIGRRDGMEDPRGEIPPLGSDWHHLAVCNEPQPDGSFRFVVFCDGQAVVQQSRGGDQVFPSPGEFCLGTAERNPPALVLHGDIKAFRLSSQPRYQGSFEPPVDFITDSDTLVLLDFALRDQAAPADQIMDLSGNERHGRVEGPRWVELAAEPPPGPGPAPVIADLPQQPLPDAAASTAAIKKVRDVFRAEFAAARDAGAMATLAGQLLSQAGEGEDEVMQFALLSEARELAVQALDAHLALRAVDELDDRFEFDAWTEKALLITKLNGAARANPDRQAIAELALDLHVEAVGDEAYGAAERLLNTVISISRFVKDSELRGLANRAKSQLSQDKRGWEAAESARQALAARPDDAAANQAVAQYLCFSRNDWDQGLTFLAKAGGVLGGLAQRDLQPPAAAAARLKLADDWFAWGEGKRGLEQNGAWIRAQHWYQAALPDLVGLDTTRAEKQLEFLSENVQSKRSHVTHLAFLDTEVGQVRQLQGHTGVVTCLAIADSGRWLVSGSADNSVRVWELASGRSYSIPSQVGAVIGVALTPDDQFVMVCGTSQNVEIWNVKTGAPSADFKLNTTVSNMAVSDDRQRLLWSRSGGGTGNLSLLDRRRGSQFQLLTAPADPTAIALSRSGRVAVAGDGSGAVHVWKPDQATAAMPFPGLVGGILDVAVSPNERLLAACTNNEVVIWDISTGRERKRLREPNETFDRIAFSRDNRRLLTTGVTSEVSLWDLEQGTRTARVVGSGGRSPATAIAFLPDPRGAVSAGYDGVLRVWRLPE